MTSMGDLIEHSYAAWIAYNDSRRRKFTNDEVAMCAAFTIESVRQGPATATRRGWQPAFLGVA